MAASKKSTKSKIEDTTPVYVWPVGIEDAAKYCKMSVAALKYHIYVAGDLAGRMIGHSITFEREVLDHFMANKRAPGRPAMAPDLATAAPA